MSDTLACLRLPPHTRGSSLLNDVLDHGAHVFPRTRGDRPVWSPDFDLRPQSSPHTRGSSLARTRGATRPGVFPAHAGIVPRWERTKKAGNRLPRTRGDRPDAFKLFELSQGSSPRVRGSSRARGDMRDLVRVFPAHAGIVPHHLERLDLVPSLPRTRGDRPSARLRMPSMRPSSPYTRRSSRDHPDRQARAAVFPAHAGIVPTGSLSRDRSGGLPRTRGDRPWIISPLGSPMTSSPHTRGSSRLHTAWRVLRAVFPAHAGIVPSPPGPGARSLSLPRTRGDRPFDHVENASKNSSSPHTRGSSRHEAALLPA